MTAATAQFDFPGAPMGSYVCGEGWLIVGDEAWTASEWASRQGRPVVYSDQRHLRERERKRRKWEQDR